MTHTKSDECLNFVSEILNLLKSANQYEKVLSLIVDRVVRMYHCQTCAIILVDPATEYLQVAISHGLSATFENAFRRKLATDIIGKLLWTGQPVIIGQSERQPELAAGVQLEVPFGSCLCVQISADHRTLGYLQAETKESGIFSEEDIRPLQAFADFAGVAVNKARLYEENLRLDTIDHDMGLDKYSAFLEKLGISLSRAQETKEDVALILMDVDNFKHIALTYGHETSKQLLKEFASIVRSHLRVIDAAGRYGFDEIAILREKTTKNDAFEFAEKMRKAIEGASLTINKIQTTVSIGLALFPEHARTEKELLLSAKEALYEAQRSGRNRVVTVD